MTCVACCPDSTPLLGCHDGTIRVLGSSDCAHSLDSAPLVCCSSAHMESGAVLVAACTRETLHLRLLDHEEPSGVHQQHTCPLNVILAEQSESYIQFSPCLRHIVVADGCSVSTYSIVERAAAASQSDSHPAQQTEHDEIDIRHSKLSMSFRRPDTSQQVHDQASSNEMGIPRSYWRSEPSPLHSSSSGIHKLFLSMFVIRRQNGVHVGLFL